MDELFNYEYTRDMEEKLDVISRGEKEWQSLCRECYNMLTSMSHIANTSNIDIFNMKIESENESTSYNLIIGKYGPVVKATNKKGLVSFIKVKDNLDLDELREKNNVRLEDVVDNLVSDNDGKPIGKYKGKDLYVRNGKFGMYAQWGNEKKSLKEEFGGIQIENVSYIDVLKYLEKDNTLDRNKPPGFVRELTDYISIRTGKYGDYVYYKRPRNKNPTFISLKGFEEDYKTCNKQLLLNWLKQQHGIVY